jgi:hypothetical protein
MPMITTIASFLFLTILVCIFLLIRKRRHCISRDARAKNSTMLALLISMFCCLVVSFIGFPSNFVVSREARIACTATQMGILCDVIQKFSTSTCPNSLTLDALVGADKNSRFHVESACLVDTWGTKFVYSEDTNGVFSITSAGPDRTFGSIDDLRRTGRR